MQLPELSVPACLPCLSCSLAGEGTCRKFPRSVFANGGWKGAIFCCRVSLQKIGVCGVRADWVCVYLLLSLSASESSPNFCCPPQWERWTFSLEPPMRMKSPQGGIEIAQYLTCAPREEETGPPKPYSHI